MDTELYKAALDVMQDGVLIVNEKHRVLYCNTMFQKLTGFEINNIIGKCLTRIKCNNGLSLHRILSTIGLDEFSGNYMISHRSGKSFCAEVTITPICNNDGDVQTYILVLRDISQMGEGKFRMIFQHSTRINIVIDIIDGMMVLGETNEMAKTLFSDDVKKIGEAIATVFPYMEEFQKQLNRCLETYQSLDLEQIVTIDGTLRVLKFSLIPMFDVRGSMSSIQCIGEDITHERKTNEQMHFLAYHDVLTGLANRALFSERLDKEIEEYKQTHNEFSILFIDLNRFKTINDTYGHMFGDKLLKAVASRISETVRDSDLVARLGGDEFAIILSNRSGSANEISSQMSLRLIENISKPFSIDRKTVEIGMSIGIAIYPTHASNKEQLLRNSDSAMYKSKRCSGNRYHVYEK